MSKESIFNDRMNGPHLLDPGAEVADPRHEKYAGAGIDVSTISVAGTTVTISWTGARFGSVNVQQVT